MTLHRSGPWLAALLLMAMPASDQASAAPVTGGCKPNAVRYSISSLTNITRTSTTFGNVTEAGVSFTQGGSNPSCVIVRFSAHAIMDNAQVVVVRAVIDLGTANFAVGTPGDVNFSDNDTVNPLTNSAEFIFPSVKPGAHLVRIQFRSGYGGSVRLNSPSVIVRYVP